ncbi:hypothetical protein LTR35_012717 [Friedmanniomyces endolithicus]|uniref:HMG box domain-containing protein n=1 Tax=Friedmanniomyces endolithicus TaxID=329885 RepID=A0AAN6FUP1_9PEZI|nr:hypothetical protein LTR35_012717 [Friedmanniomyces endolithicus]KAK0288558.1 hypothetical protein LTS00_009491 [Friedmanniomyces endolithicus]KAK0323585.1 hypothetical protein LTR82_005332 [Friedmanniomyces endolithicus]KAK1006315.1 hypothetical protein LTR54_006839 [Friedmanniomyces endolithicus]
MFGRRVVVSLRIPLQPRLLLTPFRRQPHAASCALLHQTQRTYATPGRPRKVVGEPSKPVKRAVKRAAAKATGPDSPVKQIVKPRKRSPTAKPATAKKAAAASDEAATPDKAEVKKAPKTAKKAPKTAKRAPRKPKALTEEQQVAKTARLEKYKTNKALKLEMAKIQSLKVVALKPPFPSRRSAYNVFLAEASKSDGSLRAKGSLQDKNKSLGEFAQATAAEWKQCTPAVIEHYNHLAHTAVENAKAEFLRWVESQPPETIRAANLARMRLRRATKRAYQWRSIHDERAAKHSRTPYILFSIARHASGDFKSIALMDRSKLIGKEWKALSEGEKNNYRALADEDKKRYNDEVESSRSASPPSSVGVPEEVPEQAAAAA